MRTVGTIGIPASQPPARAGAGGWTGLSPASTRALARELAARPQVRVAWLVSVWLVLVTASWAVIAGLVWLVLYALGGT